MNVAELLPRLGFLTVMVNEPDSLPGMQQQIAGMVRALFTLEAFTPRYLTNSVLALTLQAASVCKRLTASDQAKDAWQEFQNKLQTFYLFEHVDSILDISPRGIFSLPDLLNKAASLGSYYRVWVTEGLGKYYADHSLQAGRFPIGLLNDDRAGNLPEYSMVPLHAGMGLSFAEATIGQSKSCQNAIDSFLEVCNSNSRKGYVEIAYEALGLVVKNLYPELLSPVHQHLAQSRPDILHYFWHGVGRATYFSPLNFLPDHDSSRAGMEMILRLSPDSSATRNALAGFSWAMALVNIRHPQIASIMFKDLGRSMIDPEALSNGVYSSLIIWQQSSPDNNDIEALCNYQPTSLPALLWENYMRKPCRQALQHYQALKGSNSIGRLFRYDEEPGLQSRVDGVSQ